MYSKQITTKIKNIILFSRDIQKTTSFFSEGIGLKVLYQSPQVVELRDTARQKILIKQVKSEAYCTVGYNPMLNFQVVDINNTIEKLKNYGAVLDGEIVEEANKKIACLKGPDGHMVALLQYNGPESDDEDEGGSLGPDNQDDDPNMREIKNILRKIKV